MTRTHIVTDADTAASMGSGDLSVLATPAVVALLENAAMRTAAERLPEGSTTVGAQITINHLRPTAVGETVTAEATLTAEEGRKLTFSLTASDGKGVIAEGTHLRFIVDRERFMAKL